MTFEERFWAKVDRSGECWIWTGARLPSGYGVLYDPATKGNAYAHRIAYAMKHGPIPAGLQVDHVHARGCRSKSCVRPAHLEAVTGSVNIQRGHEAAGRIARQECRCGATISRRNRQCRACYLASGGGR